MDDVELRYALLEKAQSLMLAEWEHKVKVEEALARFESRPHLAVRQPTLHRIMTLAEKFYGFVKSPPQNPTNPITPAPKPVGVVVGSPDLEEASDSDGDSDSDGEWSLEGGVDEEEDVEDALEDALEDASQE
jgi:hypothetical protein